MAQQIINIGVAPGDGTGDKIRTGGDKINDNFTELYQRATESEVNTGTDDFKPVTPKTLNDSNFNISINSNDINVTFDKKF